MLVPVVDIADMGMGMLRVVMAVLMGMPIRPIRSSFLQLLRGVMVEVMGIAADRVVVMAVVMDQALVPVPMAVVLPEQ